MATHSIQIRKEVETVLARDLSGYERALVSNFAKQGMVNPIDIARSIMESHIQMQEQLVASHQKALDALKAELAGIADRGFH